MYIIYLNSTPQWDIGLKHNYNALAMSFMALDHVREDFSRGDFDKQVLQRETRWIHHLRATVSQGLNDAISFAHFL